ncbi:MAG: hypothetical protein ACJ8AW_02635, partial [Rhodopila sp.]
QGCDAGVLRGDPFVCRHQPSGERRDQRVLLGVAQLSGGREQRHPMCRTDAAVTASSTFASDDRIRRPPADLMGEWSDHPRGEQLLIQGRSRPERPQFLQAAPKRRIGFTNRKKCDVVIWHVRRQFLVRPDEQQVQLDIKFIGDGIERRIHHQVTGRAQRQEPQPAAATAAASNPEQARLRERLRLQFKALGPAKAELVGD